MESNEVYLGNTLFCECLLEYTIVDAVLGDDGFGSKEWNHDLVHCVQVFVQFGDDGDYGFSVLGHLILLDHGVGCLHVLFGDLVLLDEVTHHDLVAVLTDPE